MARWMGLSGGRSPDHQRRLVSGTGPGGNEPLPGRRLLPLIAQRSTLQRQTETGGLCTDTASHLPACQSALEQHPVLTENGMLRLVSASIRINQYQSESISINQHQSASISTNLHQSESIRINQHQLASTSINQHQSMTMCSYHYVLSKMLKISPDR